MRSARRAPIAIIGIGNVMRSDDGVGASVVDELAAGGSTSEVDLLALDGEPTRLIEAWDGRRFAIVVDAIAGGAEVGTIHRLEVGVDRIPDWSSEPSSHSGGLSAAVALAEVLGRTADRLVIYGIEPLTVAEGMGLSPGVWASVAALAARIRGEINADLADWARSTDSR